MVLEEQKSVFRKKSLERLSSPEELNDYIKVARPGIWIILIAVIIFLVGVVFWCTFGRLDSAIKAPVVVVDEDGYLFVSEMNIGGIQPGAQVTFGEVTTQVLDIMSQPVQAREIGDDYFLYVGSFSDSTWLYICTLEGGSGGMPEGIYEARVVSGYTSPMSFITN